MVADSERLQRIEVNMTSITAEADFLGTLADIWERQPENSRVDWYIEWRDLMARLESLDRDYRDNAMTLEQNSRYKELLGKLKAALPIMRRLELELPSVSLDAEKAA